MPLSPRTLRPANTFTPRSISGLALWLDASASGDLYTTDAGPVVPVSSPTEISGCVGWWDASDAASITQSGGLVSQLNDKSGQNNHATASGGLRPTLTGNALNGRSVLTFGGSQGLTGNLTTSVSSNAYSVFAVCRIAGAITNGRVFSTSASLNNDFASGNVIPCVSNGGTLTAFSGTAGAGVSSVTGFSSYGIFAGVLSSNLVANAANGMSNASTSATQSATVGRFGIGIAAQGGTGFNTADIAEIVYYNTALSTADRARVEAYLAQRWGITGVHAPATSASDPVGYWRDRSGNGRHATQATGASRPQRSTVNSRGSIQFDGTDDTLGTFNIPTSNDITLFCAWRTGASIAGGGIAVDYANSGDPAQSSAVTGFRNSAGIQVTSTGVLAHRTDSVRSFTADEQGRSSDVGAISVNTTGISTIACSYGASTTRYGAFNGASLSATTRFNGGIWSALTLSGRRPGGTIAVSGPYWAGQLCELLIYERNLAQPVRRKIEAYLAAKWGIVLAPQVSNADAQDWINRVYANGGSVTSSTAAAVNQFCIDIDAASIRDRFYRLNLLCGGTSGTAVGLNSAMVPLYRGPSLGGTQYGDTIDTNNGPFLPANYAETGASGGLTGNGTSRYLTFGTVSALKPAWAASHHFGIDIRDGYPDATARYQMGAFFNETPTSPRGHYAITGTNSGARGDSGIPTRSGFTTSPNLKMVIRSASNDLRLFEDGTQVGVTQITADTATVMPGGQFCVMASSYQNVSGGTPTSIVNGYAPAVGVCRGYTIGEAMDDTQRSAFAAAWNAFQQAMGRR